VSLKTGIVAMALALVCTGAVTAYALFGRPSEPAVAVKAATKSESEPLVRSDPGVEPWREETVAPVRAAEPKPETLPEPPPEPEPPPRPAPKPDPEPGPQPEPEPEPEPRAKPVPRPEPEPEPVRFEEPPEPTAEQIASAHEPRRYRLPDGAVLGLTVEAIGIHDVPVFDSVGARALKYGVGHHPETSMPWPRTAQRNVYLAGHRLGFPGTASHLVFYRLDELGKGDGIVLKRRDGSEYRYRVTETFEAGPEDAWVTGQIRDRDMLTLQTCTGPNWERRLIVRAERV
jgi:sortase A